MKGRVEHFETGSGAAPLASRQFHGARNQIDDTHVRPPSVTGAYPASSLGFSSGSDRPAHTDVAFATDNEHAAWQYAMPVSLHPDHPMNNDPDPKHRGRVYEVGRASDQFTDSAGSSEIQSQRGFPILREHHAPVGVRATFPDINWNAFKAKPTGASRHVSSGDRNQSYMEPDPDRPPPREILRREGVGYQSRDAVDPRHPAQLNLYSGRSVAEHNEYENTPGVTQHLSPGQFQNVDFHRDPTTSTIRRAKEYHRVDEQFGTVHG